MLYGSCDGYDYGPAAGLGFLPMQHFMSVPLRAQRLFFVRKVGETDRSLGMRVAFSLPVALYPLLFLGMLLARVGGEAGLVLSLAFWLFIGVWEWLYLGPAIGWALTKKHVETAKGLTLGGLIIAITNGVAWGIGMYMGVRQWVQ